LVRRNLFELRRGTQLDGTTRRTRQRTTNPLLESGGKVAQKVKPPSAPVKIPFNFAAAKRRQALSSIIFYKDDGLYISNQRFSTILAIALEVGDSIARDSEEGAFVQQLRGWTESEFFNGCDFDLGERFSTTASRKFWATVFFEVARRIFLRKLGNQETDSWQPSAICDTHSIGRLLVRAEGEQTDASEHPR
jgi:hypothetical protein